MRMNLLTILFINFSLIAFGQENKQNIFGFKSISDIGFIWQNVYETKLNCNEINNIISKYKGYFRYVEISDNIIYGIIKNIDVDDVYENREYNFFTPSGFLRNVGIQSYFMLEAKEGKYRITISKIEFKVKSNVLEYNRLEPSKIERIIGTNQIISFESYEKQMNLKTGFFKSRINPESVIFFENIDKTFKKLFDLKNFVEIDSESW